MEYDYKKIVINTLIASVISLIIGLILSFLNIGEYSFVIGLIIAGIIVGYLDNDIDSALLEGGVAGLVVGLVQGIVTSIFLPAKVAALFPLGISLLLIAAGAIPAGIIAIILSETN